MGTRLLRSSKFVVGLGIEDMAGSKQALTKALQMAQTGDKIVAVHIPKMAPELLLSSLSDPSASDDIFSALIDLPGKAGDAVIKEVRQASVAAISKAGKGVAIDFQVADASENIKQSLLQLCKKEGADFLMVGPGGSGGSGSTSMYCAGQAKGTTVCVVRD